MRQNAGNEKKIFDLANSALEILQCKDFEIPEDLIRTYLQHAESCFVSRFLHSGFYWQNPMAFGKIILFTDRYLTHRMDFVHFQPKISNENKLYHVEFDF